MYIFLEKIRLRRGYLYMSLRGTYICIYLYMHIFSPKPYICRLDIYRHTPTLLQISLGFEDLEGKNRFGDGISLGEVVGSFP